MSLTRRQQEILNFLVANQSRFAHAPTLDELCGIMGLKSRGSLHKHVQGLIQAGLVESPNRKQRGVRLTALAYESSHIENIGARQYADGSECNIPFVGSIAAGLPIEALENITYMNVPEQIKTENTCYVLQVKGDSMIEEGIFEGDWVVIEKRNYANNGEIVVALIDKLEATLKIIEQHLGKTVLIPANKRMKAMTFSPNSVEIQGVLVGQMRSYIS